MRRILLIDSEPKPVEEMLKMFGYEVTVAQSGYNGLRVFNDTLFDTVILDAHLSKVDGWTVLKMIRSSETNAMLPVIMLTNQADEKLVVNGLRRGADLVLGKPITPSRLIAHLEAISRRCQWERESSGTHSSLEQEFLQVSVQLLTHRERELLGYLIRGFSNQQISQAMVISETTVKNHLAHIFKKLNVANRTQAAFIAQKLKLVPSS